MNLATSRLFTPLTVGRSSHTKILDLFRAVSTSNTSANVTDTLGSHSDTVEDANSLLNGNVLPKQSTRVAPIPNYSLLLNRLDRVSRFLGVSIDSLPLSTKILFSHLANYNSDKEISKCLGISDNSTFSSSPYSTSSPELLHPGENHFLLNPDRVAMQDASAQMALLQFMLAKTNRAQVPTSIHCDHLIRAHSNAKQDLELAKEENREVFDFLESCATKYGMSFWGPGSGIIHQIVLEHYATPGLLMIGTDSHTPNAGGLGTLAIGVGGADAVDALVGTPWELKLPQILGIRLHGVLGKWCSAKDLILYLVSKLSVSGGTNKIIEYFGPGVETLSCTSMATCCNMGAELGATSSIFPFTNAMKEYLIATNRSHIANAAEQVSTKLLIAGRDSESHYDNIIDINLSDLEPVINGPFTPDLSTPLSILKEKISENKWPEEVKASLIGSCTNSSYEDMQRAVSIAKQAVDRGLKAKTEFYITPASENIRESIEKDGTIEIFEKLGAKVLANACGPCIGQWDRKNNNESIIESNVILTSFNRNFRGRNDGNKDTMNFLASPEIVTAFAISGSFSFDPQNDYLTDNEGNKFKLNAPKGDTLPKDGFSKTIYENSPLEKSEPSPNVNIKLNSNSDRLQELNSFEIFNNEEFKDLEILCKIKGKCTTDHISAAGPWLKYKGHLENISKNTLIGAFNSFTNNINKAINNLTGKKGTIPEIALQYKNNGIGWVVVADENYGEGSAREHAALQPRYLGCKIILAKSFARIHETNLKKQGILPLTFVNKKDYDLITNGMKVNTKGLVDLTPHSKLALIFINPTTGEKLQIPVKHSLSEDQIEWFKAGSAINKIAQNV